MVGRILTIAKAEKLLERIARQRENSDREAPRSRLMA